MQTLLSDQNLKSSSKDSKSDSKQNGGWLYIDRIIIIIVTLSYYQIKT